MTARTSPLYALLFTCLLAGAPAAAQDAAGPSIRLLGHASVLIESQSGSRVVLDPFHRDHWIGEVFPTDIRTDAVAITHPHFDHNAASQLGAGVPVFERPGTHQVGDIRLRGVAAEHVNPDRYRAEGSEPWNTFWVVEVDGVRIMHTGDNAPPSAASLAEVGQVDVILFAPWQSPAEMRELVAALRPRVIVPVHLRIGTHDRWFGQYPDESYPTVPNRWVADLSEWEVGEAALVRIAERDDPELWTGELTEAWAAANGVASLSSADALEGLRTAARLAPDVLVFRYRLAVALAETGDAASAIAELEGGFAASRMPDTETAIRAHVLLGRLLVEAGRAADARAHFEAVADVEVTYAADAVAEARAALGRQQAPATPL